MIEVKSGKRWSPQSERRLRAVAASANFKLKACVGVYLGEVRLSREGVEVYPLRDFVSALYAGETF